MNAIDDLAETHRLAIDSLKQRMADFEAHLKASSPGEDLSGLRRDYSVFKEHVWSVLTILQQQMLERQSAFTVARKLFGVRSVWTMDGNINIKLPDGRRRRVFVYEEVVELGTEHGRSLEVPQPSLSTKAGSKIITVSSPAQVSSRSRRNGPKK
ncbi:hypothetical protein HF086_000833 [Spodoptera exigua]|uniref:Uncharacterized protein n=1 Tax=Spodoptera exigua TaxID=7107 RepID=A0A922MDT6_SPOEX|nr:hypothetical protein HF086_008903 [Spodoptera exigua]KAH9635112.1 hypothetical protein HF086_000833 [Spodoptera exigua]